MQNVSISQCLLKSKKIRKHYGISLRAINNGSKSSENDIPDEIEIEGDSFKNSQAVAAKLNEYFTSVSTILNNENSSNDYEVNITNSNQFKKWQNSIWCLL